MIAIQIAMLSVVIYGAQVDVFHFPLKGWWLLAGITVSMFTLSNRMTSDIDTHETATASPEAPAHA